MVENTAPQFHRDRLEAILANAVDSIVTIDERGIVESANPATESMFGYRIDELIGQNVNLLMPEPYRSEHDGYISNYLSTGIKRIIGIGREIVGRRKDGSVFAVNLAISELRLGKRQLFTGIIRDISELKAVQAKLVQNERLAAIGQMVAGLAHESRNAFQRSHACLANLAFDVSDMPQSLELVHKVQASLDELNALMDEVRNYAAPIVLEKSPTDVATLAEETWRQIVSANPQAINIALDIRRDEDFPKRIKVDRVRLGQVLWNLLENSRSACDCDKGKIVVWLKTDTKQNQVRIEVHDNGPGIDPQVLPNIFEPFFTTKTKGTGLGLAICRRIVDAFGGELKVTCGETTCFAISLPADVRVGSPTESST